MTRNGFKGLIGTGLVLLTLASVGCGDRTPDIKELSIRGREINKKQYSMSIDSKETTATLVGHTRLEYTLNKTKVSIDYEDKTVSVSVGKEDINDKRIKSMAYNFGGKVLEEIYEQQLPLEKRRQQRNSELAKIAEEDLNTSPIWEK